MSQFSTFFIRLILVALGWAVVFSPVGASGLAEDQTPALPFGADRDQQVSPLYETSPQISLATMQERSEPVLLDDPSGSWMKYWPFQKRLFSIHAAPLVAMFVSCVANAVSPCSVAIAAPARHAAT